MIEKFEKKYFAGKKLNHFGKYYCDDYRHFNFTIKDIAEIIKKKMTNEEVITRYSNFTI